jgi:hypothetical protein
MRSVSRIVRGVAVLSVVVSLAAPMQARPTWGDVTRAPHDFMKIVQKWLARALGDGLIEPHPGTVTSTGDGLTEPHP